MFASLFRSYGPAFRKHILPRPEELKPFWTKVAGHPALQGHDVLSRGDRFTKAIPIGVHGDDCPVSGLGKCWVSKLSTLSWYSFMGMASRTLEKLLWIYSCPEKYRLNQSDEYEPTLDTFFRILAWSLTWLYRGQWPDTDFNGDKYRNGSPEQKRALTPLAGGYYCVLLGIIGDLDWFHGVLKLQHYGSSKNPCCLCKAQAKGPLTYTNFKSDAPWRATIWKAKDWIADPSRSQNPIFRVPSTSCHVVAMDLMHVKYLGCDMYMLGSVIWLLCHLVLPNDPAENLRVVWHKLKECYVKLGIPASQRFRGLLKASMYTRKKGYPKLRGKAYEVRHLIRPMLDTWLFFCNSRLHVHQQISLMLKQNVLMESVLTDYKEALQFPAKAAQAFRDATTNMLLLHAAVATHFAHSGIQVFDLTSKFHLLQHIADYSEYISPRVVWCFSGEDLMRHTQKLAQSSSRGVGPCRVVGKMARKYRLALHLEFSEG
ncbi:unnamed protein product [Symbiodinium necroappetens]|uniref:Uncharacterized protein n=1 Tax=Symbiodinium necroappetens TaxID=1628268 RepID=A0A812YFQ3_9DINO|nr:unnamed protein product [Symbiodinium necroappetens]